MYFPLQKSNMFFFLLRQKHFYELLDEIELLFYNTLKTSICSVISLFNKKYTLKNIKTDFSISKYVNIRTIVECSWFLFFFSWTISLGICQIANIIWYCQNITWLDTSSYSPRRPLGALEVGEGSRPPPIFQF